MLSSKNYPLMVSLTSSIALPIPPPSKTHFKANPRCFISENRSAVSDFLRLHGLYSPWNSPGQNTGWVTVSFSRGFSQPRDWTQVSHIAAGFFYQLNHEGSPTILEWVAHPFFSGSSSLWNPTGVSCIAGGLFTNWATREA